MGSNVPLVFLVHCTLTTVTLTLMELALLQYLHFLSIKIVVEIYGVVLNEFELAVDTFQVLHSVEILYNCKCYQS